MNIGVWIALGILVGVVIMAVTGDAFWIAVGAGVGIALGAAMTSKKSEDE